MAFTFGDLTDEERLALVGLLKVVIQADKLYGRLESVELKRLASQIGSDRFHEAVEQARVRFPSVDAIKEHAATIERPAARALIFEAVQGMALADQQLKPEELEVMRWLAELWRLADVATLALK
jgi:uncharacterized tellurite resistance protein B-like protein